MDENENLNPEFLEDPKIYEKEDIDPNADIVYLIKDEIRQLYKERSQYASTSRTYMVLTQRITEATEELRNAEDAENARVQKECAMRNKYTALAGSIGSAFGNFAGTVVSGLLNRSNVKTVVGYENDGGIVNSKGMSFITKPRG